MMRRIQSAALVLALFALPMALVARAYAGAAQECAMACCRGERASAMHCAHGTGATPFAMCGRAAQMPDYGLAAPIAPTQLSASLKLPPLRPRRSQIREFVFNFDQGHLSPPFEPPRA